MDLRTLDLDLRDGSASLLIADAKGERRTHLLDEPAARAIGAAAPLVMALEKRGEGHAAIALTLDFQRRTVRARLEGDREIHVEGDAFAELAPLAGDAARGTLAELRGRRPEPDSSQVSSAGFWSHIYQIGDDGWELGRAAPPIARWLAANPPSGKRVLVAGCGRGHEARLAARLGARVTAVDIAPEAVAATRALAAKEGLTLDVLEADVFALPSALRFDLILEHTLFCAIDPARRSEYVRAMAAALDKGGQLVGLFWNTGRPGGPPFAVEEPEVRALMSTHFTIDSCTLAPDSVAARLGRELLMVMTKI